MAEVTKLASANEEAIRAWDGVLFDRFVEFRHVVVAGLSEHGSEALRVFPPEPGDDVLDIGCGFGDASQQIAGIVGPQGSVHGVDAAPRFIETARREARDAGLDNVSFDVADVQVTSFEQRFDYAFSRMGTMFFANPVPAMRNVREALRPGGRLVMVVWRQKAENEWVSRAEHVVERFVTEDENSDEPTCGPGPFSMANADTTSGILLAAGFSDVSLRRCDLPYRAGRDLDEAIAAVMAIGPAGEVLRLAGEEAVRLRPQIEAALREEYADLEPGPDGLWTKASTWIVTATAP
jgi:SAM-dependent methyltransferase